MGHAGRATWAAAGVACALASLVVVGDVAGSAYQTTYGATSAWFAALEAAAGACLAVAAVLLLSARATAVLGGLALAVCVAWFAPVWRGWESGPGVVRSVGLVVSPLLPALLVSIAAHMRPPPRRVWRIASLLPVALVAAVGIGVGLVRDPIRDPYCWSDCTLNLLLVDDDPGMARRVARILLVSGIASGLVATLVCLVRLGRSSAATLRRSGPAFVATALAAVALAAYGMALEAEPHEVPGRPLYAALFVARAFALLALAGALVWLALRPHRVRGLVTRFAVDLERTSAVGGLGPVLASALGDPGLRLCFPVGPGDRLVDGDGRRVILRRTSRVTPIIGAGGVAALVESNGSSSDELERELGPAAQLALGNERLRAETLARLAEVADSRARIVEASDRARRRMERDLHDGAQQQLLALTYDLRVALETAQNSSAEPAGEQLRVALDRAVAASAELREVAHGIFPAELASSGLVPALQSLADLHPLRLSVDLRADRRYPPEIETAAYAVVAEAVEDGGELRVRIADSDAGLQMTLERDAGWDTRLERLEDRIGAVAGDVRASGRQVEALLPVSPSA